MLDLLLNSVPLRTAHTIAKHHKQDIFLVGGAVRDLYLTGSIGRDLDFLLLNSVASIAHHFAQSYGGTVFCLDKKRGIYRTAITTGKDLTSADFSTCYQGNLISDLITRDFTLNALAINLTDIFERHTLAFIDPGGGLDDLRERRIRVVTPASLVNDPVRMLRAVRLSRECTCRLLAETEGLIQESRYRLLTSPWERIRNEFFLILNAPAPASSLEALDRLGLLPLLIPELEPMKGQEQGRHHTYTLWEHSLNTVYWADTLLNNTPLYFPRHAPALSDYFTEPLEETITRRTLAIFIALLHDTGKPGTKTSVNGTTHFFEHDHHGMKINREVAKRFKLSRKTGRIISAVTQHHMRPLSLHQLPTITDRAQFRLIRDLNGAFLDTLVVASADALAARASDQANKDTLPPLLETVFLLMDYYFQERGAESVQPLLTGNEIMEALHLVPGREVGVLLKLISDAEREGRITTKEEARELIASAHARRIGSGEKGKLGDA